MMNPDSWSIQPLGPPLILASGSPRRHELLADVGIPFEVIVSHVAEIITPGLSAEVQAVALAEQKARDVASRLGTGIVLAADTVVVLDGKLLGKPSDDAEAAVMLRDLSGREHRVVTGVTILQVSLGSLRSSAVSSGVRLRPLSDDDIASYAATGEPRDKAGAYAIQGLGGDLVAELKGCYTNVVGLPLCETASLLREAGIVFPAAWPGCRLADGTPCPRRV